MSEKLKRKSDWNGRYVMLKFDIETNGGAIFKAGDIMLVERNHGGLHLMATRNCKECGQQHRLRIIKVAERDVDLLPSGYVPENRPSRNEFLQAELAAAQAEVERLRGIIREAEWSDMTMVEGRDYLFAPACPICETEKGDVHSDYCQFYQWEGTK